MPNPGADGGGGILGAGQGARRWYAALAVIVALLGMGRLAALDRLFPYVQNVDEHHITRPALKMIQSGSPNPEFFRYPSLPIYLATGSLLFADLVSSPGFREQDAPFRVASNGGPYDLPNLFRFPRTLFVVLSILTLGLVGLIAGVAFRSPAAMLLAPVLLALGGRYQRSALLYLNVDIIVCFFVAATLAVVFSSWSRDSLVRKSVLPGVLAGMAVASKYNSGLILVPCALAILWSSRERRSLKLALLGACAAAAFFVCVPYSLLDTRAFIADVLFEVRHYQRGHAGFEGEPGLPQLLWYLRALANDFGASITALSLFGLIYGILRDPRRVLVLASFPVLVLLHMSTLRVHFLRTVLPVLALLPVFAALGVVGLARLLEQLASRWLPSADSGRPVRARIAALAIVVLVALPFPWRRGLDRNVHADSRNLATAWLGENVGPDAVVLLARDIRVDRTRLAELSVEAVLASGGNLPDLLDDDRERYVLVPRYVAPPEPESEARNEKTLRQWNAATQRLVEVQESWALVAKADGAHEVLALSGRSIPLPLNPRRDAPPTSSPELSIYRIPGGVAESL